MLTSPRCTAPGRWIAVTVPLAAVLLATTGCGGHGHAAAATSPTATQDAPADSTSAGMTPSPAGTTGPASPAAPTATVTVTAAAPSLRCHTSELHGAVGDQNGAAGTIYLTVRLTNLAQRTCTVRGWPGLGLLDRSRHVIAVRVQRVAGSGPNRTPQLQVLAPGATVSALVRYSDMPSGTTPCPTSAYLELTPPDERDFELVPAQLAPCQGGPLEVTPLAAGSNGTQFG